MSMRRLILIVLLLVVATPAQAVKKIMLVGDSLCAGTVYAWTGSGFPLVSRHAVAIELRSILAKTAGVYANATVIDACVPGTTTTDWYPGPPDATTCSLFRTIYPILQAACTAGDGLINHVASGNDVVLLYGDEDGTVLQIETLRTQLDAVNGTILVTSPPHGPSSGTTAMPADSHRAARVTRGTDLNTAGDITGPDWRSTDWPMQADGIHQREDVMGAEAALWIPKLP